MADKYKMNLIVPAKLVGPIMELLDDEGIMVETVPYGVEQDDEPTKKHKKRRVMVNGMSLADHAVKTLHALGGEATSSKLCSHKSLRDYAENSIPSALGRAVDAGYVQSPDKRGGKWTLTDAGKQHALDLED